MQNIKDAIRNLNIDIHRLGKPALTYRLLDFDLRRIVVNRSPVVFDIGANKGQTIEFMLRLFPGAKVFAFEPAGVMADALIARYSSRNVAVYRNGMGAVVSSQQFHNYSNNELSSFLELSKKDDNPFSNVALSSKEIVQIDTVDSFALSHQVKYIDILKIDTQGFDFEVLKGAQGLFERRKVHVVQVELNFANLYEGQGSAGQIIDSLSGYGYRPLAFYETVRDTGAISWATAVFINPKCADPIE